MSGASVDFHLWSVPNLRKPLHTSQIFRQKPTWCWWVKVQACSRITPRCFHGHRTSDGVHRVDPVSDSSRSKMQQICFHWCSSADREQPQPVLTGVQGKVSVQVGNIGLLGSAGFRGCAIDVTPGSFRVAYWGNSFTGVWLRADISGMNSLLCKQLTFLMLISSYLDHTFMKIKP